MKTKLYQSDDLDNIHIFDMNKLHFTFNNGFNWIVVFVKFHFLLTYQWIALAIGRCKNVIAIHVLLQYRYPTHQNF